MIVSGILFFYSSLKPHHITSKKPSSVLLMDIQSWSTLRALWNKHVSISPTCPLTQKCILRRVKDHRDKEPPHTHTTHSHIRWAGVFHLGPRRFLHPLSHPPWFYGHVKYWLLCSKFYSQKLSDTLPNLFHLLGYFASHKPTYATVGNEQENDVTKQRKQSRCRPQINTAASANHLWPITSFGSPGGLDQPWERQWVLALSVDQHTLVRISSEDKESIWKNDVFFCLISPL